MLVVETNQTQNNCKQELDVGINQFFFGTEGVALVIIY
jgi:hypothetical protein